MSADIVLPASLDAHPDLDTWLRVDPSDTVTVFTGKVEIGQGIVSAIARIAAEELDLAMDQVRVETADTAHGLNEGHTAGSMSVEQSGAALRQAAAEARAHLLGLASAALDVPVDALVVRDGTISVDGPADAASHGEPPWTSGAAGRSVSYWDLLGGRRFDRRASGRVRPKKPSAHRIVGRPDARRIDLRGLITGDTRFVSDLRPDGLAYGRVVRPPTRTASLVDVDDAAARAVYGVIAVVRNGSFLGVVAERESQAVRAGDLLRRRANWADGTALPAAGDTATWLREQPGRAFLVVDGTPITEVDPAVDAVEPETDGAVESASGEPWTLEASYSRPYLMHGSIGPSAAVARWDDGRLDVWTSSQSVYTLRAAMSIALDMPMERIRARHVVGAGCYGHNGADDAAFEAALLAMAVPGRPVRLQWSRADEHQWEPYGAPAYLEMRATIDGDGRVSDWCHDVWGTSHLSRPLAGGRPNFVSGPLLDPPVAMRVPEPTLGKEVGIHRNAAPIYDFPRQRIVKHFVAAMPLRTSSLRSLGAHANVFAIESFMDELAVLAQVSPIDFRLRHLGDERACAVLTEAARAADWHGERSTTFGHGTGIAIARYKNRAGYAAVVARVHIDDATSRIVVDSLTIAADCGEIVDPRGLVNQLEGGALQATSWTLRERVEFDETMVTSVDWETYPILRFPDVPSVETVLLDRPGLPYLGAGEITQGPTAGAIGNAVFDAIGYRLRDMPLTPDAVRRAAATTDSAWAAAR